MSYRTQQLHEQLKIGVTTIATIWGITRLDGEFFGFTDHDHDISFLGRDYLASSGLSASAISQGLGLAVDNTEAAGALDDERLRPEDIDAGLFDNAKIEIWRLNWQDLYAYEKIFYGHLGQMQRDGHAFRVEMRGYMDQLQMPMGRIYGRTCGYELGDERCQVDVSDAKFRAEATLMTATDIGHIELGELSSFEEGWFSQGLLRVLDGRLSGQTRRIRTDQGQSPRILTLWEPFAQTLEANTKIELIAGCNRSFEACQSKFNNCKRFGGFPYLPNEDWLVAGVGRR